MKNLISALIVLSSISVSAQASTYNCKELSGDPTDEVLRAHYSIVINEIADIRNKVAYGRNFDHVYDVKVKINSILGNTTSLYKSFETTATVMDVAYTVNAVRSNGIKISLFLDNADDAYMEETLSNNRKIITKFHCE